MKSRAFPLTYFLTLTVSVPVVEAQRQPTKAGTGRFGNPTSTARIFQDYIYGVVKKIDKSELVLEKTVSGVDEVFKLDPKIKFIRDGKPSTLEDFKVGDKVFVERKKDKKTGDMVAKKVVTGLAATQLP